MADGETRYTVWLDRDVIHAEGPESETFLQGQLSQDIEGMLDGQSRWTWVLSPAGKVDALARITRLPAGGWLLDTDGGFGDQLLSRLERFRLRTKVTLSRTDWKTLALRGPGAAPEDIAVAWGPDTVAVDAGWPRLPGTDLFGSGLSPLEGWVVVPLERYEADRIVAGVPRMGLELTERTIPAETGLNQRTVSFTKGCYTGQELVARIDSRGGHVARHLRLLLPDDAVSPGSGLRAGDKTVGEVTSVARRPSGEWVALGYVHRSVDPLAEVRSVPGDVRVVVQELER